MAGGEVSASGLVPQHVHHGVHGAGGHGRHRGDGGEHGVKGQGRGQRAQADDDEVRKPAQGEGEEDEEAGHRRRPLFPSLLQAAGAAGRLAQTPQDGHRRAPAPLVDGRARAARVALRLQRGHDAGAARALAVVTRGAEDARVRPQHGEQREEEGEGDEEERVGPVSGVGAVPGHRADHLVHVELEPVPPHQRRARHRPRRHPDARDEARAAPPRHAQRVVQRGHHGAVAVQRDDRQGQDGRGDQEVEQETRPLAQPGPQQPVPGQQGHEGEGHQQEREEDVAGRQVGQEAVGQRETAAAPGEDQTHQDVGGHAGDEHRHHHRRQGSDLP